jgi:hypothetical protein
MEKLYNLDELSLREIKALRVALDTININGIDALFVSNLQIKLNNNIQKIEKNLISKEKDIVLNEINKSQVTSPTGKK